MEAQPRAPRALPGPQEAPPALSSGLRAFGASEPRAAQSLPGAKLTLNRHPSQIAHPRGPQCLEQCVIWKAVLLLLQLFQCSLYILISDAAFPVCVPCCHSLFLTAVSYRLTNTSSCSIKLFPGCFLNWGLKLNSDSSQSVVTKPSLSVSLSEPLNYC